MGIPSGANEPYLIVEDAGGTTGLASYTGSLDVGDGDLSEDGSDWQADTSYQGVMTGYDYFSRILQEDSETAGSWDGSQPGDTGVYMASGDVTSSGSWNVDGGDIVVIVVDGNVVIDENIEVAEGSFAAIIASSAACTSSSFSKTLIRFLMLVIVLLLSCILSKAPHS